MGTEARCRKGSTAAASTRNDGWRSWGRHIGQVAAVVGALAGLVGVVLMWEQLQVSLRGEKQLTAPVTIPSPSTGSVSTVEEHIAKPSATSHPVRLKAACTIGGQGVPCDLSHNAQAVDVEECSVSAFIAYAGGDPQRDVLHPSVETTANETGRCIAAFPSTVKGSVTGALIDGRGDAWRWCHSSRLGGSVPCAEAHDGEVVFVQPIGIAGDMSCPFRAEAYLDIGWSRVRKELAVQVVEDGPWRLCVVGPRGDNRLIGSLRSLGTDSLSLGPPL